MADGELTKFIRSIPALHDIEFLQVGGSYVSKIDVPYKVPSTRMEAVTSPLVGKMQKIYLQSFLQWIASYKDEDPSTHRKSEYGTYTCRGFPLTAAQTLLSISPP